MNANKVARPRLTPAPVGKSGRKTLQGATLAVDKNNRAQLRAADRAAFLAAGGLQEPTVPTLTPALEEELYIQELFSAEGWGSFASL